jgi:predicted  nucleic acid-binding Zn-ribbon protein
VGEDQITALMVHIDKSLDRSVGPIRESISGLNRNIEKIFDKLNNVRDQVISAEGDVSYFRDRIEEDELKFEKCQENCEKKMETAKEETGTTARLKVMVWVLSGVVTVLLSAVAFFLSNIFYKIQ